MCYGDLADFSRKMEKYDFLGGHKLAQDIFKNDSDNVEGFGRAIGWRGLEEQGKWNQQNPEEGMAHAGVATAAGFLGNWLGGLMGGGNSGYVDQVGNAAEGSWAGASTGAAGAGGLMGSGVNSQKAMQMMQMMKAMEQPQQPGMAAPPPRQGQVPELSMSQGYTPTSANSFGMGMPKDDRFLTEEEKRKRRLMRGY